MASGLGSVRSESIRFLENTGNPAGGNAGVWTASFDVPVGAVLIVAVYIDQLRRRMRDR